MQKRRPDDATDGFLPAPGSRVSDEEAAMFAYEYEQRDMRVPYIAQVYGRCKETVYKHLHRLGVKVHTVGRQRKVIGK